MPVLCVVWVVLFGCVAWLVCWFFLFFWLALYRIRFSASLFDIPRHSSRFPHSTSRLPAPRLFPQKRKKDPQGASLTPQGILHAVLVRYFIFFISSSSGS